MNSLLFFLFHRLINKTYVIPTIKINEHNDTLNVKIKIYNTTELTKEIDIGTSVKYYPSLPRAVRQKRHTSKKKILFVVILVKYYAYN